MVEQNRVNKFLPAEPVTQEMLQELLDAQAAIPAIRQQIARAKELGLDVAEYERQLEETEQFIKRFLRVYGGKPE